jgi:hypothetical protein
MRFFLSSAFIFLLFPVCSTSDPNNDLGKEGLHGAVKTLLEIAYEGRDKLGGDSLAEEFSSIETKFDRNGYLLEKSYFDKGKLILRVIPQRDKFKLTGNLKFNGDGNLMLKSTFNKISENDYNEISFDSEGKPFSTEKIHYENNRKMSSIISYQSLEYETMYKYNTDGLLISSEQKNNSGEIAYNYIYEYSEFDKFKNWTRRKDFNATNSKDLKFTTIRKYQYY